MSAKSDGIVVENLVQKFNTHVAVSNLSFGVPRGCIYGFLGRNGAGKSTTMRIIAGIAEPCSGVVRVLDRSPSELDKAKLGYLAEERGLYKHMTALEVVSFFGRLKGMSRLSSRVAAQTTLESLGVGELARRRIVSLSKGNVQKIQIASSIVSEPEVLVFDEPFSGLDPGSQQVLERVITDHARKGGTVLLSTHVMQDVERLCDRLCVISKGQKVYEGTCNGILNLIQPEVELASRMDPSVLTPVETASQLGRPDESGIQRWRVKLRPEGTPSDLLQAAFSAGLALSDFDVCRPSLHEVFLQITSA